MADPARIAELSGRGFTVVQLQTVAISLDPAHVTDFLTMKKPDLASKVEELERLDPLGCKAEDIIAGGPPPPPIIPSPAPQEKSREGRGLRFRLTHKREDW